MADDAYIHNRHKQVLQLLEIACNEVRDLQAELARLRAASSPCYCSRCLPDGGSLQAELETTTEERNRLIDAVREQRAELARLRAALARFGRHDFPCEFDLGMGLSTACVCGLRDTLEAK